MHTEFYIPISASNTRITYSLLNWGIGFDVCLLYHSFSLLSYLTTTILSPSPESLISFPPLVANQHECRYMCYPPYSLPLATRTIHPHANLVHLHLHVSLSAISQSLLSSSLPLPSSPPCSSTLMMSSVMDCH